MKWDFLNKECDRLISKGISNTQIAKNLLDEFEFDIRKVLPSADKDTIRMYVSKRRKLLNLGEVKGHIEPNVEKMYLDAMKSIEEIGKLIWGNKDNLVKPVANTCVINPLEASKPGVNPSEFNMKMPDTFGKITPKDTKVKPEEWVSTGISGHLHNMYGNPVGKDVSEHIKSIIKKSTPQLHLILGCIHVPFHNKVLLDKILQLVRDNKFTTINLIGDVVDCNSISSYSANNLPIDGLTLEEEYKKGAELILDLLNSSKLQHINYLPGNHELRTVKYNQDIKNAKTPVKSFSDYILSLIGLSSNFKTFSESIKLGSYELIHGIYYNEYPSKKHLNVFRKNMVFAHTHRIGNAIESNIQVHNIGWLGDINSLGFSYANPGMKQTWRNGFGILVIDGDKEFFHQITCDNNSFYFNGRVY